MSELSAHQQEHLLAFIEELSSDQQQSLKNQIAEIDLAQIATLFQKFGASDAWAELASRAEPPVALRLGDTTSNHFSRAEAEECGSQLLNSGKVGMILVAGGQGSRLGFDHPKGMYPLGPVTKRTLFQIHIDKLMALNHKYGSVVPLYVMTSPATHQETADFLNDHDWFGYPKDACQIFCQGTMPAVDCETGKILLAEKGKLFASPDGHGGMLAAFDNSGCLADVKQRELSQIFYCQIDNPLAQICDEATLGYHVLAKSEVSSQAVPKTDPLQKVGNIVSIDGKVQIIEYSDLPETVARKTTDNGGLALWAGNIAVHIFDVKFLDRMTDHADALPFHLAHKKVPYVDSTGTLVKPEQPNAIKFERFIFDLLPMASHSIVVEVDPQEAFSPVKNAATESHSTAKTAQESMMRQARRILNEVGVSVAENVPIEIDPHLVLDSQRLKEALNGATEIDKPTFLGL